MKRKIIKVSIVLTAVVLVVSFSASTVGFRTEYKVRDTYRDISKEVKEETKDNKNGIDFDKLKKINPDVVGWIDIPDTVIDYPIVASTDNYYYLNHSFKKENSQYGAVFTDCRLSSGGPFNYKNCIVYGHNMGRYTDVMFSTLMKYENEAYYKAHQEVIIYTPEKTITYKIVSVREVSNDDYAYSISFQNNKAFIKWIKKGVKDSMFKSTETLENVEKAVTLSTCTYGTNKLVLLCISED